MTYQSSNDQKFTATQTRKDDHIRICLDEKVQGKKVDNGLDKYRFNHYCLPEIDWQEIDISGEFLGKKISCPLLISSMTGGTNNAQIINQRLAKIAQQYHIPMGVGSGRVIIEKPETADSFQLRSLAPDILLLANLGAVQLNYGYTWRECQKLVDILSADGLILHLNPLQECIQSQGDTNFKDLLNKISRVCEKLTVPIIIKEVGNGISAIMAEKLINAGVAAIDVAGAGGTSWAMVESERADNKLQKELGKTFADWGIPTAECVINITQKYPHIPLIASGGIRNGLEVAKLLALGADLVGLAYPFLLAATQSDTAVEELMELLIAEIKTALFCTGNINILSLQNSQVLAKI